MRGMHLHRFRLERDPPRTEQAIAKYFARILREKLKLGVLSEAMADPSFPLAQ